jgi:hypothetical protein
MSELHTVISEVLPRALVPVVQMQVERMPRYPRPWYLPAAPGPSIAQQKTNFAWLAKESPGVIRRMDPAKKAAIEARYRRPD